VGLDKRLRYWTRWPEGAGTVPSTGGGLAALPALGPLAHRRRPPLRADAEHQPSRGPPGWRDQRDPARPESRRPAMPHHPAL